MITESELYWITRMDGLGSIVLLFLIISIFFSLGFFITFVTFAFEENIGYKFFLKGALCSIASSIIWGVVFALIPTSEELAVIKAVPIVVNQTKSGEPYARRLLRATLEKIEKKGEK